MTSIIDISYLKLFGSCLFLLVPVILFYIYKIKLISGILVSVLRMILQLTLVALYLDFIFTNNNPYLNTMWVMIMIIVDVATTIKRINVQWKYFVLPLIVSNIITILIIDIFLLCFILQLPYILEARYFIPMTGMILGNALSHTLVGLKVYFNDLNEKYNLYLFLLTNTSSIKLAIRPFIKNAVYQALNPLVASIAVIGLISLPGMMTGQILGGSSPIVAIKYQFIIMISIFVGCTINIFLSIIFLNKTIFDRYYNIKKLNKT